MMTHTGWVSVTRVAHRKEVYEPLVVSPAREALTRAAIRADAQGAKRVLEFFAAQINNNHTRKAYLNAPRCFAGCAQMGLLVVLKWLPNPTTDWVPTAERARRPAPTGAIRLSGKTRASGDSRQEPGCVSLVMKSTAARQLSRWPPRVLGAIPVVSQSGMPTLVKDTNNRELIS
jgi:hypothetical protein